MTQQLIGEAARRVQCVILRHIETGVTVQGTAYVKCGIFRVGFHRIDRPETWSVVAIY